MTKPTIILPGEGNQPFATVRPASAGEMDAAAASIKEATMTDQPSVIVMFEQDDRDTLMAIPRHPSGPYRMIALTAEQRAVYEQLRKGGFSIAVQPDGTTSLTIFDF